MRNFSGFGNIPPVRRWEQGGPAVGTYGLRQHLLQRHAVAQSLFTPAPFSIEPAGYGMMPRASAGSAVSALRGVGGSGLGGLGGLGLVNVSFCPSFEDAIDTLGSAVKRGSAEGLTSQNFLDAKEKYENETSYLPWKRTPVSKLTNCEDATAIVAMHINNVNAELKAKVGIPANVQAQANDALSRTKPPEEMSPTAKFAIIGGITVVGIVAVAVIVGQVAPLLRIVKKVV